jgi:hypothetical protein
MEYGKLPHSRRPGVVHDQECCSGTKPNRTVRAVIPRLVWAPGSKGSITPVNVPQAVSPSASREPVGLTPHRVPGALPGGGLT